VAKLPSHHCWSLSCQLNLGGVAPFVPMLPLSAQHIRGLVVVEIPRSSEAGGWRSPRWQRCWSGLGWKGQTLVFLAANRARLALVCSGQLPVQALARDSGRVQTDMLSVRAGMNWQQGFLSKPCLG